MIFYNLLTVLFFVANCRTYKLIRLYKEDKLIKTLEQIREDISEVKKAFSDNEIKDEHIVYDVENYDIFQYKDGSTLVASVLIKKDEYLLKKRFIKEYVEFVPTVEIYSLYIKDSYRNKGIARRFLKEVLEDLSRHYNMHDFIVCLHLNEEDAFMNVAFSLYYTLGLRRGTYCIGGPYDLMNNFEEYYSLSDPIDIIKNPKVCKKEGDYFAMYTFYNDMNFFRKIEKRLFNEGEKLRKILQDRKVH